MTLASPSTTDEEADESESGTLETPSGHIDSVLPYTQRLPSQIEYDRDIHALVCGACGNRYDANSTGMERAIECCSSMEQVERDDIPVCDVNLKLSPEEREESEWTDRQLMFLQVVYNAQQLRYDPIEYDLLRDSMIRLREYVGIDSEAVQDLIDADLLRKDTDYPHRLYTVTPDGRSVIGEGYRRGIDYGHGIGDLEESSQHVLGIELGKRYLEHEFVEDPDSDAVEVIPYFEPEGTDPVDIPASLAMGDAGSDLAESAQSNGNHRLDIVALDQDGEIVATTEVERINHDAARAIPDDYDKMAANDPEAAIWIVMNQSAGYEVLCRLNDPPTGEPRVEKTYSETTPPRRYNIDEPGCTDIYTLSRLQSLVVE